MDLGLEWAGMETVGQVEIDQTCRSVLARHWPTVPRHDDVATAVQWWEGLDLGKPEVVSGGFPCQPFSQAGHKKGAADSRYLWPEFADVLRQLRPRYAIVENVPHILKSPVFGQVLGDLAALGFDAEWGVLSACAVGAPHTRNRLFIVAYANGSDGSEGLADRYARESAIWRSHNAKGWRDKSGVWIPAAREPGRMVAGLAERMVKAGGNAVVPYVAEFIGRYVMSLEEARNVQ